MNFSAIRKAETSSRFEPSGAVAYPIKFHVMANYQRVQRVFWYNYVDSVSNPCHAEDYSGLSDYRDYPQPAYSGYPALVTMLHNLADKSSGKTLRLDDV